MCTNLMAQNRAQQFSFMSMSNSRFLRDSMLQLSIPTRDNDYYISDGNTVLLVQNTLFKVSLHPGVRLKDGVEGSIYAGPPIHTDERQVNIRYHVLPTFNRVDLRFEHLRRARRRERRQPNTAP